MEAETARIIVVSGSHKQVGKTTLIEKLLPFLGRAAAVKISTQPAHSPGEERPDSDTSRYLAAGAEQALFIHGSDEDSLQPVLDMQRSGRFDTICCETNRFSDRLDADLRFFVRGTGDPKDNAASCEAGADIIIEGVGEEPR